MYPDLDPPLNVSPLRNESSGTALFISRVLGSFVSWAPSMKKLFKKCILHLRWHRDEYNLAGIHYHVLHSPFSYFKGNKVTRLWAPVHRDKATRGQV